MKKQAIDKARKRLDEAAKSLERVSVSQNWDDFEIAWGVFLKAAKCVPEILRQGSKQDHRSRSWFGQKESEMKGDQLLSYMNEARNAEEHGIEPIAREVMGSITIAPSPAGTYIKNFEIKNGRVIIEGSNIDGSPLKAIVQPGGPQLIPVIDRKGNVFKVPNSYLGKPLENQAAPHLGKLWVQYFENMLIEAEALVAD